MLAALLLGSPAPAPAVGKLGGPGGRVQFRLISGVSLRRATMLKHAPIVLLRSSSEVITESLVEARHASSIRVESEIVVARTRASMIRHKLRRVLKAAKLGRLVRVVEAWERAREND